MLHNGFLEKNRDTVLEDHINILRASEVIFLLEDHINILRASEVIFLLENHINILRASLTSPQYIYMVF
jgi:hypothetical protein